MRHPLALYPDPTSVGRTILQRTYTILFIYYYRYLNWPYTMVYQLIALFVFVGVIPYTPLQYLLEYLYIIFQNSGITTSHLMQSTSFKSLLQVPLHEWISSLVSQTTIVQYYFMYKNNVGIHKEKGSILSILEIDGYIQLSIVRERYTLKADANQQ